ncbi:pyocin knob domain-containing protein [Microbacterium sp. PM5]|uniref:pyocin knob domain-containing protein n=1 Tax=Microbacterium sp. PM5 TaxID=2014534 RepID=UPI000DD1410A|nr:pyocin knob domain-containing protein [Microbacterium sp. PM5]AXA97575.1 hypothetical protein CEP17_14755 [Microbacterium sp. PM5]
MTVVNLRGLHTALGVPAVTSGVVMVEYWAGSGPVARVDGADVVFPALITAAIVDGDPGTLDLVPTRGVCCVRWTIQSDHSRVTVTRFTEIPETGSVTFGALQQVDPATFVPTADVVAAWEAAIDDVAALRDQAVGSASTAAESASTASASATSAAGSADAAGVAATAASGSASAAAGSASTASTGAATATTKATAASSSADAAATSATAAAGSASAAAGSASAAGLSKTDADAARVAAQTAQTGAETARAGAEAARDLALAGQFVGSPLGTTDLNTIVTPGVYRQGSAASLALNYPTTYLGTLYVNLVANVNGGWITQTYYPIVHDGSQGSRVAYSRSRIGTTGWTPWRAQASQRVDQTAGRAIYPWDDLNNREQLIYGDTGIRSVADSAVVSGGAIYLRRYGAMVSLTLQDVALVGSPTGTVDLTLLPTGFRSQLNHNFAMFIGSNLSRAFVGVSTLRVYGAQAGQVLNAHIVFMTTDPWPTTLPGTASGTIPNT